MCRILGTMAAAPLAARVVVMYAGQCVETAGTRELLENPKHPYTQALLSAIPMVGKKDRGERILLEGDIPSPVNPPAGCRFSGRCNRCMGICTTEKPELREVEPGHFVACHLYNEK